MNAERPRGASVLGTARIYGMRDGLRLLLPDADR